jgi:hypothetical protein
MIVRYSNGYKISNNVIEALRYLGKVGIMSTKNWHEFFSGNKHIRWQHRQIKYLCKLGYIKPHPAESMRGKWILGDTGKILMYKLQWPSVFAVPAHHIDHDETVGRSLLVLSSENYIHSWMVERELKMINQKEFMVSNKDGDLKYPDAIFKINVDGIIKTVAIEYERRGKSETRYRSILWSYARLSNISLVLFICEDEQITRRIEKAYSYLKRPELFDRLATTRAIDWKTSPMTAPIKMNRGIIKLIDVCRPFEELLAS